MTAFLKNLIILFFVLLVTACSKRGNPCDELSQAYWTRAPFGKPHNTKIKGENLIIRNAFKPVMLEQEQIEPPKGFINLKLHIDKYGNFCSVESFEIDENYKATSFNNGELIEKLESIAPTLQGWSNNTKTKTYYLIKFVIDDGIIKEVF